MLGTYLKSKLHLARVTEANSAYEGSITIDQALLEAVRIVAYEQVHVWDVTNGTRLVTYAIPARPGSKIVCVNGAGARVIRLGDRIIVASFVQAPPSEAATLRPWVLLLDETNTVRQRIEGEDEPNSRQ